MEEFVPITGNQKSKKGMPQGGEEKVLKQKHNVTSEGRER